MSLADIQIKETQDEAEAAAAEEQRLAAATVTTTKFKLVGNGLNVKGIGGNSGTPITVEAALPTTNSGQFWNRPGLEEYSPGIFEVENLSYKNVSEDKSFRNASLKIYKMIEGEDPPPDMTPQEIAEYGINEVRWFNNNIAITTKRGLHLINKADPEQLVAWQFMSDAVGNMENSWAGFGKGLWQGVLTDVSTLASIGAGLFTWGTATAATIAANTATRQGIKYGIAKLVQKTVESSIGQVAKTGVTNIMAKIPGRGVHLATERTLGKAFKRGAVPGMLDAAATNIIEQRIRTRKVSLEGEDGVLFDFQRQEEFSQWMLAFSTAGGGVAGGGFGMGFHWLGRKMGGHKRPLTNINDAIGPRDYFNNINVSRENHLKALIGRDKTFAQLTKHEQDKIYADAFNGKGVDLGISLSARLQRRDVRESHDLFVLAGRKAGTGQKSISAKMSDVSQKFDDLADEITAGHVAGPDIKTQYDALNAEFDDLSAKYLHEITAMRDELQAVTDKLATAKPLGSVITEGKILGKTPILASRGRILPDQLRQNQIDTLKVYMEFIDGHIDDFVQEAERTTRRFARARSSISNAVNNGLPPVGIARSIKMETAEFNAGLARSTGKAQGILYDTLTPLDRSRGIGYSEDRSATIRAIFEGAFIPHDHKLKKWVPSDGKTPKNTERFSILLEEFWTKRAKESPDGKVKPLQKDAESVATIIFNGYRAHDHHEMLHAMRYLGYSQGKHRGADIGLPEGGIFPPGVMKEVEKLYKAQAIREGLSGKLADDPHMEAFSKAGENAITDANNYHGTGYTSQRHLLQMWQKLSKPFRHAGRFPQGSRIGISPVFWEDPLLIPLDRLYYRAMWGMKLGDDGKMRTSWKTPLVGAQTLLLAGGGLVAAPGLLLHGLEEGYEEFYNDGRDLKIFGYQADIGSRMLGLQAWVADHSGLYALDSVFDTDLSNSKEFIDSTSWLQGDRFDSKATATAKEEDAVKAEAERAATKKAILAGKATPAALKKAQFIYLTKERGLSNENANKVIELDNLIGAQRAKFEKAAQRGLEQDPELLTEYKGLMQVAAQLQSEVAKMENNGHQLTGEMNENLMSLAKEIGAVKTEAAIKGGVTPAQETEIVRLQTELDKILTATPVPLEEKLNKKKKVETEESKKPATKEELIKDLTAELVGRGPESKTAEALTDLISMLGTATDPDDIKKLQKLGTNLLTDLKKESETKAEAKKWEVKFLDKAGDLKEALAYYTKEGGHADEISDLNQQIRILENHNNAYTQKSRENALDSPLTNKLGSDFFKAKTGDNLTNIFGDQSDLINAGTGVLSRSWDAVKGFHAKTKKHWGWAVAAGFGALWGISGLLTTGPAGIMSALWSKVQGLGIFGIALAGAFAAYNWYTKSQGVATGNTNTPKGDDKRESVDTNDSQKNDKNVSVDNDKSLDNVRYISFNNRDTGERVDRAYYNNITVLDKSLASIRTSTDQEEALVMEAIRSGGDIEPVVAKNNSNIPSGLTNSDGAHQRFGQTNTIASHFRHDNIEVLKDGNLYTIDRNTADIDDGQRYNNPISYLDIVS